MCPTYNMDKKILSALEGIDMDKCRRVMLDYDGFINRIQHEMYNQTFIELFRDAEKINNKGLCEADLQNYITSTLLTSEKISMRLREPERVEWT